MTAEAVFSRSSAKETNGVVRIFADKKRKDRIFFFLRKFYAELRGCVINSKSFVYANNAGRRRRRIIGSHHAAGRQE